VATVPNYQSLEAVPLAGGADVSGWPLWRGSGAELSWTLDLDRLRSLLRPDTRLVAVNFPNNPTGYVPDRDTFVALAELCHERGIVLVCDEVYRGIEVDPARTLPHAADLTPTAVSVNVMSKSYGLPGLRIGWVACRDRSLLDRLERRKHWTSICNAGPSEYLAVAALGVGERIHARNRAVVAENVTRVRDFFAGYPDLFAFEAPVGGCVSFPRYLGPDGPDAFARDAAEQAGVLTLPASIYASGLAPVPTDRIRIGFGRTTLPTTLAALRDHLDRRPA
jgi:aspartate/methionine/tyrosine aminotransferase